MANVGMIALLSMIRMDINELPARDNAHGWVSVDRVFDILNNIQTQYEKGVIGDIRG